MDHPGKESSDRVPFVCPNCQSYLYSAYEFCPFCGQRKIGKEDRSFRHFLRESFLDYFHFDSKFYNSIVPLIFKPGVLTVDYFSGKRASHIPPFKMFVVISLVYFLILSLDLPRFTGSPGNGGHPDGITGNSDKANLRFRIKEDQFRLEPDDSLRLKIRKYGMNTYVRYKFPEAGAYERYLIKKAIRMNLSDRPFNEILRHNASKLVFLLIPVVALLLRLIFYRRKRFYTEHLIFSLHFHSFVFIVFLLSELIAVFLRVPMLVQLLIILVYLFFALKRMYVQSPGKTLLMFFFLVLGYVLIALPLFFLFLAGVSVATY